MKNLNESLNYMEFENQLIPMLGIDEYESRIGDDEDIIVLNFLMKSKEAAEDLAIWLERGYDFIIDAEVSPGEVEHGKFYIFAEMNRRPSSPRKIMELLDDLDTLCGIKAEDWELKIENKKHPASREVIEEYIPLTANNYKMQNEKDINEWRELAGLQTAKTCELDDELLALQRQARII